MRHIFQRGRRKNFKLVYDDLHHWHDGWPQRSLSTHNGTLRPDLGSHPLTLSLLPVFTLYFTGMLGVCLVCAWWLAAWLLCADTAGIRRAGVLYLVNHVITLLCSVIPNYWWDFPRSSKLPVLNLLRGQKSAFSPHRVTRCTDSCVIWHDQGARGSASLYEISRQSVHGGGFMAPKFLNFHFLLKIHPQGWTPRSIVKILGAFMHPTIIH